MGHTCGVPYAFDRLGFLQFEQLVAALLELEGGIPSGAWSGESDRCRTVFSGTQLDPPLLAAPDAFALTVDELAAPYADEPIDKVIGIEARGFVFAAPVAYRRGHAAEGLQCILDDCLGISRLGNRERRSNRLAPGPFDFLDHVLRRTGIGADALQARADVADNDARALLRHAKCDRAPDTAPASGDYHNFAGDDMLSHADLPQQRISEWRYVAAG